MLSFMARKRARFREKLNLLFSLARSRVLQRRFAAALFSLVRKKVSKKYAEGLRALLTPGNAVKLRLRFAPHVLRRYLSSTVCGNARKRGFSLLFSDMGLTQAEFYKNF